MFGRENAEAATGGPAESPGLLSAGTWTATPVDHVQLDLKGGPTAPGEARHEADARFAEVLQPDMLASVLLLVTELVSNAVRHGGADEEHVVAVHLATAPECIRVEVCDRGPGFEARRPEPYGEGGYGLFLVDQVASRWGVSRDDGTCAWFELDI